MNFHLTLFMFFGALIVTVQSKEFCVLKDKDSNCIADAYTSPAIKHQFRSLCANTSVTDIIGKQLLTVKDGVIGYDKMLTTICDENNSGVYGWISAKTYEENIKPLLNLSTDLNILLKKTYFSDTPTEEDSHSAETLIERIPVTYKLSNIVYSSWRNISFIKIIQLGYASIENPESTAKYVEGEIEYGYEGTVKFDSDDTIFFPDTTIEMKLHDNKLVDTYLIGENQIYIENKTEEFAKQLPPNVKVNVTLEGSWANIYYEIEGDVIIEYGENFDNFTNIEVRKFKAKVNELKITNVSLVFDDFIELLPSTITTVSELDNKTEPAPTIEVYPPIPPESLQRGPVYPGFRPYFQAACAILIVLVLVVTIDITRICIREKRAKKSRRNFSNRT